MPPPDPIPLLSGTPVVPVLTIERVEHAVPLARALVAGGLNVIEVTLRTRVALEAIAAIAAQVPECGVGAKYLVSPGTTAELAAALAAAPVPALPGCASVSEALALSALGFRVLKFFPAEPSGGIAWLKSVAAPCPQLKFCPTGGIDLRNAGAYLALPNVIAVGGSWPAPQDAVAAGHFARITELAREAAGLRR